MKCTSRIKSVFVLTALALCLSGCGSLNYSLPYEEGLQTTGFQTYNLDMNSRMPPFADSLCVEDGTVLRDGVDTSKSTAALLFDVKNKDCMYAKNIHMQMHPASLTKIMTALVALENGKLDMTLQATTNTLLNASGVQVMGLKAGDSMTLEQALNILLVYSANDVAMLIAEGVGGNITNFVDMMNEKAKSIGATNTHFSNPHGLTEDDHLTTAYDMYLIFNEAVKYEKFTEIIQKNSYQTSYDTKSKGPKEVSVKSTNKFINGGVAVPSNVSVIGGKTGTTKAAGNCLILLCKDKNGNSYIAEILQSDSTDSLYQEMSDLLLEIDK